MKEKIQEIIQASKGKIGTYTILSRTAEERMIRNGWRLRIKSHSFEKDEELVKRLLETGYTKIKLYDSTTAIRGLYDTFAMVKK